MRLPFTRRKDSPDYFKGIRERSTIVESAEAAWPRLRSTRTVEENREALKRIHARRAANGS